MRLLYDQNHSPRLAESLADLFPGSVHVREAGLKDADDIAVWEYAKLNGLVIVSKDSDFHQRSFLFGPPPKVIWIRLGNCSTHAVEQVIRANVAAIESFCQDKVAALLCLS